MYKQDNDFANYDGSRVSLISRLRKQVLAVPAPLLCHVNQKGENMSKTNRREFLMNIAPFISAGLLIPTFAEEIAAWPSAGKVGANLPASFGEQSQWRECQECRLMYWGGEYGGRCVARKKGHSMARHEYDYFLEHGNLRDTRYAQINWRFCNKCFAMFFDGYQTKGRCAAGGGHNAQGFNFRLPHSVLGESIDKYGYGKQGNWRFCAKCCGLFRAVVDNNDVAITGRCAAGDGHAEAGYTFVLRYRHPTRRG
ncbi:MAG: hypothetical protein ABR566_16605 [Pyrinomonadaceae bacterium]